MDNLPIETNVSYEDVQYVTTRKFLIIFFFKIDEVLNQYRSIARQYAYFYKLFNVSILFCVR